METLERLLVELLRAERANDGVNKCYYPFPRLVVKEPRGFPFLTSSLKVVRPPLTQATPDADHS